ncbi:hypothetical protein [Hoeflea ulvae]|uniref:DUF423 domain-containing protein n=1 Tax=Hoeflea ulvae TaxID=2983764 RepID=A0ABT3YM19_9HYPH|nr:hypothetical protein [Hoeflea ulvae]MCY0096765.1 hypothetical protein [Hoeflea ulvae]
MTHHSGWSLKAAAVVGMVFGLLTIVSGGNALFGDAAARAAVGNAVPFVLWFNFAAGFAYVAAGGGLLFRHRWALWLSLAIVIATVLVFAAFALHVQRGGPYEMRTVGAMVLRTGVWLIISVLAWGALRHR